MKQRMLGLGLLAALLSGAATAAEGTLTLGAGLTYSSGDYGTSTTTKITSIPFTAKYETGLWAFKLTVPYVEVSGSTAVIPGIGRVRNTNPMRRGGGPGSAAATTTTGSASGLGDVVAAVTRTLYYNNTTRYGVDLTGKIKFGTADRDKGLGTGENDYGIFVEPYKSFGQTTVFGALGYTHLGSSEFIQLNNVFSATVGALHKLDTVNSLGVSLDARERASDTSSPQREVTAFYIRDIDKRWKAQAYVLKGFADGSPDWGAGATLSYAF